MRVVTRVLVLFAREPSREAREKGLTPCAAELFAAFARRWLDASRATRARFVVASPGEDLAAWRRRLPHGRIGWITQSGRSFGERLAGACEKAAAHGDRVVFVGGDVSPEPFVLDRAFEAFEGGADAVLAPAPDGGISLLSVPYADLDLLGAIEVGSRSAFEELYGALEARGRAIALLDLTPDVDGRRDQRRLVRRAIDLPVSIVRRALAPTWAPARDCPPRVPRDLRIAGPSGLRAPPAAA